MADVTRRMLDLLALLQTGRRFSGAELARSLGTSERTVRRDADRLRGYGYPVQTRPGPGGHYRLVPGRAVPPLMLDDDEAVAMLLALATASAGGPDAPGGVREAAARAYGKLDQLLPRRLAATVAALRASVEADAFHAPDAGIAEVTRLATAIRDRRVVEFEYHRPQSVTRRHVEPHRQVHHLLRWYLVAWDLDKDAWRVFRTDRLRGLRERTQSFASRSLPADTALALVQAGIDRASTRAVVSVDASPSDVAAALPYESMELMTDGAGRTRVVFHCTDWQWLLLRLSRLGVSAVVHEPAAWAQEIRRFASGLLGGEAPVRRPHE